MKKIHTKNGVIGCPSCGGRMSVTLGWPRWFRRYGPPVVLRVDDICSSGCGNERGETIAEVRVNLRDYANEVWAAALATYWYRSVKLRAI